MLINSVVPQVVLCLQMYIVAPLTRCLQRRKIRTQEQMNSSNAGPTFDISVRYPARAQQHLRDDGLLPVASPVLLFIAAATAFGTYWFDKLSIIHLYSVKTAYDEELGETALSMLPWTLVLHLGFSTWMYGNTDLLKTNRIDLGLILNLLNIEVVDANGTAVPASTLYDEFVQQASKIDVLKQHGLVVRLYRPTSWSWFLIFVVLVVGLLLSSVFRYVFWPLLRRTIGVVVLALWRRLKKRVPALVGDASQQEE
ncbi:hypothetical protein PINS_up020961 [Pythium insidiosum]|nr:hypothetical protein PINS_up020961 [Pythium insidiosum]